MPDRPTSLREWHTSSSSGLSFEEWLALRRRAQTDLFWLGTSVLGKPWVEKPHREFCDFFVRKDPDKPFEEQSPIKERLLLAPRGSFKSTIHVVDKVQWTICFPDVRILILTATDDLASAFVEEYKHYFFIAEGAEPTDFQKLFPEFVFRERKEKGPEGEFVCPARTQFKKDPTIWSSSITSTLPGWHCDILGGDDAVNNKNSEERAQREKVIRNLEAASNLVDPGGYVDLIGTPYDPGDAYAHKQETASPGELLVLQRAAWWPRPGYEGMKPESLKEDQVELLFEKDANGKPRLTYHFLRRKSRQRDYYSQYLCVARSVESVRFTDELIDGHVIGWNQLPRALVYYIAWDFAYSRGKKRDYTVGAVGALDDQNRLFIIEVFRDRFIESDLAFKIAESYREYMPRLVLIENSNGAEFLSPTIHRKAEEVGLPSISLDFFKVDNKPGAKDSRIGALQTLLADNRLFFLETISCLDDLKREFVKYGSDSHDDIPDAISHLQRVLPVRAAAPPDPLEVARVYEELREKELEDMMFGSGHYAPPPPPPPEPEPEAGPEIVNYF